MTQEPKTRYAQRGVSSAKTEVHKAVAELDQGIFPSAFCKLVADDLGGDDSACLVMHADDVGTKTALAYLAWREGFGDQVWEGIAQDSLVMNLDDCACVGALGPYLLSNTISRNARLVTGEAITAIIRGYRMMCQRLADHGIVCGMTGGETSDCGDVVRTVFADSVAIARLPRSQVIDAGRMQIDDVIVGFASDGQAVWEDGPNSGIGSNGLTSARHDLLAPSYRAEYPESFDPSIDPELVYCGRFRLEDRLEEDPRFSIGSALLSPTRTYLPLVKKLVGLIPHADLHALIHCTGGGQTKIRRFGVGRDGRGLRFIKDALPPPPPLFRLLKEACGTSWAEAYSTWNMGIRLEAVLPLKHVATCLDLAREARIAAWVTGRVALADGPGNEVVVRTADGESVFR